MARRSDPARIAEARQAATRNRLIADGLPAEWADEWIAAWVDQAAAHELERDSAYWTAAWDWIAAERQLRPRPPSRRRSG
jgi:hypothetical protein